MKPREILMIALGRIERFHGFQLRYDRVGKHFGCIELRNISRGDFSCSGDAMKMAERYSGPVSGPCRFSSVGLCAIGKKHFQDLPECDLRRIICHLHGFRMAGRARADRIVMRGFRRAARITGYGPASRSPLNAGIPPECPRNIRQPQ